MDSVIGQRCVESEVVTVGAGSEGGEGALTAGGAVTVLDGASSRGAADAEGVGAFGGRTLWNVVTPAQIDHTRAPINVNNEPVAGIWMLIPTATHQEIATIQKLRVEALDKACVPKR
jgi:hypothetical protein